MGRKHRNGPARHGAALAAVISALGTCLSALAGYSEAPTLSQLLSMIGASGLAGAGVALAGVKKNSVTLLPSK